MNSKIKIRESDKLLLVEIKPDPKPIVKYGMMFFYVMPFTIIIVFAFVIISQNRNLIDDKNLLPLGMIIGSGILVYIFLKKIFEKEILIVDKNNLTLLKRFLFNRQKRQLEKKEIKDLKYVGREEFTDHPLDTRGFDSIGLGTGEKEVQWFIESGNLTFNYKGSKFRFGKNIWEEEGNELIEKLKKYGCQQGV